MYTQKTPTELKQGDFGAGLRLFKHFLHDRCTLQARLKDTQSRLFVDDAAFPQVALLCSADGKGISFVSGDPNQASRLFEFILASAEHSPQLQFVSLPSDSWRQPTPAYPEAQFFEFQRVSFTLEDAGKVKDWQKRVPQNFSMQRIDQRVSEQIRGGWSQWFPEARQFEAHGLGFCLLHEARVVSLAYGLPISDCVETIVETQEKFQGQGLAALCCAALIEECLQNVIKPVWSAGANHQQSVSVAQKLGFGNAHFHWWLVRRQ